MNWQRRKGIERLANGILEVNIQKNPPIQIIDRIMLQHDILFQEIPEAEEFCGIFFVKGDKKGIIVNSNLYSRRKNFTIAHELGHYFLDHPLSETGTILCDQNAVFGKDKPEIEKEADYFAACLLMPETLVMEQFSYLKNTQLIFSTNDFYQLKPEVTELLSEYFQVSKESMGYRLDEICRVKKGHSHVLN